MGKGFYDDLEDAIAFLRSVANVYFSPVLANKDGAFVIMREDGRDLRIREGGTLSIAILPPGITDSMFLGSKDRSRTSEAWNNIVKARDVAVSNLNQLFARVNEPISVYYIQFNGRRRTCRINKGTCKIKVG